MHGPGLMRGYLHDPDANAAVLRGGWLETGDLGCLDATGRLWLVDRREDLIVRAGQNVYPAEIEAALRLLPEVADAAVVPIASPDWGQVPFAFVVAAGGPELTDSALIRHCIEQLADYKRPVRFMPIHELPRSPSGKILRTELRRLAELV